MNELLDGGAGGVVPLWWGRGDSCGGACAWNVLIGRCGDERVHVVLDKSTNVRVCRACVIPVAPSKCACCVERVFDSRGASVLLSLRAKWKARDGVLGCLLSQKG